MPSRLGQVSHEGRPFHTEMGVNRHQTGVVPMRQGLQSVSFIKKIRLFRLTPLFTSISHFKVFPSANGCYTVAAKLGISFLVEHGNLQSCLHVFTGDQTTENH